MAQKSQNRRATRPAGAESEFAGGEFATFAREEAADHRNFRLALGGAVAFHLILLLITFPELYSEPWQGPEGAPNGRSHPRPGGSAGAPHRGGLAWYPLVPGGRQVHGDEAPRRGDHQHAGSARWLRIRR